MSKTIEFDIGNTVVCDLCDKDYTNSDAVGGFVFESKGVCPECAPNFMQTIAKYGEDYIRARANPQETYRDFILRVRNGNNKVRISGSDAEVEDMADEFAKHLGIDR